MGRSLDISAPIIQQAKIWLNTQHLSKLKTQTVAVGWSGGIDSTALLLALHSLAVPVQAWHVDHAWHEGSADDALHLKHLAKQWGIPFLSRRLAQAPSSNREAEARSGRYHVFTQLAQHTGVTCVCLAHHGDDQAETVYMRMLQGSGVLGCCGMKAMDYRHQLLIMRPLLDVRRSALEKAMIQASVPILEDESNQDMRLWRNHLRLKIFPLMQQAGFDPYELFLRWQAQASLVAEKIQQKINAIAIQHQAESCSLEWLQWRELSQCMRAYVLQYMFAMLLGEGKVLGRRHLELIEVWRQHVLNGGGLGGLDLSGCHVSMRANRLHLTIAKASCRT